MSNLSKFPSEIDHFIEHQDIGFDDLPSLARFKLLRQKQNPGYEEVLEMNQILINMRDKIFQAYDLNKLQDCMTNIEVFTRDTMDGYMQQLRDEQELRTDNFDSKINEFTNSFVSMESTWNTWFSDNKNDLVKYGVFNFDNLTSFDKVEKKTTRAPDKKIYTETIVSQISDLKIAERITTRIDKDSFNIVTKVFDKNGVDVLKEAIVEIKRVDDEFIEKVIGFNDYNMELS